MKVALIHYRLIHFGGLETRLKNYIDFFSARGDEVTVICAKYDPNIVLPPGVRIVQLKPALVIKPYRQRAFDRKLGVFLKPDSFDFILSLGRTSHQKNVLCPGNHMGYLAAMNVKKTSWTDRIQIEDDRRAFNSSEKILAASRMMAREVNLLYDIPKEKIKVLYPPLNTSKFPPVTQGEKPAAKKALQLDPDKKYFLFVGVGHKRKGLALLLDVFKELEGTDCHLLILGGPPVQSSLSNLTNLGYREDTRQAYMAADFLVHPSIYEPYGQIVAESLQCQTPVIISTNTGAGELIENSDGLILPLDTNKWLTTLKQVNPSNFHISPNFAQERKITLEDHMQRMLD